MLGTSTALMENEGRKESETDKKAPRLRRKAGLKFAPKASSNSATKNIPKNLTHYTLNENYGGLYWEPHGESKVAAIDKELMLRLRTPTSTNALGSRAKAEKQETPIQVAFGQANPSVPRTFPTPRSSSSDAPAAKLPKKHDDPWDYTSTNYPVTLPLRCPYSGDPDIDEHEFRQLSSKAHDGKTAAEELGLMDRMDEPQLLFFQLPHSLPLRRQADLVAEADTDTNVDVRAKSEGGTRKRKQYPNHGCKLRELPGGVVGKMLVYKSGKVKMKLGDAHFDVSAGSDRSFAQEAVAVDTREKLCSSLGEVGKVAIVTPDIDYLLDCIKME